MKKKLKKKSKKSSKVEIFTMVKIQNKAYFRLKIKSDFFYKNNLVGHFFNFV